MSTATTDKYPDMYRLSRYSKVRAPPVLVIIATSSTRTIVYDDNVFLSSGIDDARSYSGAPWVPLVQMTKRIIRSRVRLYVNNRMTADVPKDVDFVNIRSQRIKLVHVSGSYTIVAGWNHILDTVQYMPYCGKLFSQVAAL